MKNDWRIQRLTQTIKQLEHKVKGLEKDKGVLENRNHELIEKVKEYEQRNVELQKITEDYKAKFDDELKNAINMRRRYEELVKEAEHIKSEYRNELNALLKRIRKR